MSGAPETRPSTSTGARGPLARTYKNDQLRDRDEMSSGRLGREMSDNEKDESKDSDHQSRGTPDEKSDNTHLKNQSANLNTAPDLGHRGTFNSAAPGGNGEKSDIELELQIAMSKILVLEETLKSSLSERDTLRSQITTFSNELCHAQDLVFSLQSRVKNITEAEATAGYSTLCGNVENWVQSRLNDVLDDRKIFFQKMIPTEPANHFLGLTSATAREAFQFAGTDEYCVIAAIMQFLRLEVFETEFYCPLAGEEGGLAFLAGIERGMRSLEPRPDLSVSRTWRSETFTALANRPIFASQRAVQARTLAEKLTKMLHMFVPRASKQELQSSIHSTIIEPALSLAHKLQLSVDKISIRWTPYNEISHEERQPHEPSFAQLDCANLLADGRLLRFPLAAPADQASSGSTITYISDILPMLVYEKIKADTFAEPKVLKKAKVLVAVLRDDGQKPLRRLLAAAAATDENATIMGSIFDRLRKYYARDTTSWQSRLYL